MSESNEKLLTALGQWRDSLVNLTGRNRLLNYKPTRASTIEFSEHSPAEVYSRIDSRSGAFTIGTRPPAAPKNTTESSGDPAGIELEDQVLGDLMDFDFEDDNRNLATNKTQIEVARILKRLAGDARREYLDKGISILYAAFGALHWIDDSGDTRRSPLILVPVSLISDGPRQPLRLVLSDDELSINPALAIKMLEYGISLPNVDDVEVALSGDGLDAAISLFHQIKLENGWSIEPLAVLANFMFAKEAMYRDLLDNEDQILLNPILRAMAGISIGSDINFTFDEIQPSDIDAKAPPETTPLVLDADYSQRAAIAAAVAGKSFVLDGPPGTGKSQTIANIIGALIEEGKKVLFVSEKAVALDVVRDRLKGRGLDPFLLELHSHKAIRKEVATRLGRALDNEPIAPSGMDDISVHEAKALRVALNGYADAMNEIRHPISRSVFDVLGEISKLGDLPVTPLPSINFDTFDQGMLGEVQSNAARVSKNWSVITEGANHLWFGLHRREPFAFDLQAGLDTLDAYTDILDDLSSIARAVAMPGLAGGARLDALLTAWHRNSEQADAAWLTSHSMSALEGAIDNYESLASNRRETRSWAAQKGGQKWEQLPVLPRGGLPTVSSELADWYPDSRAASADQLTHRSQITDIGLKTLHSITNNAALLSDAFGLKPALTPAGAGSLIDFVDLILSPNPPLVPWVRDKSAETVQRGAHELRTLIDDEALAADSARAHFKVDALSIDLEQLGKKIREHSSFFKRFGRDFKSGKAELETVSLDRWQESLTRLDLVSGWKTATIRRTATETAVAGELGDYFTGPETDWNRLNSALDTAQQLLASELVNDPSRLVEGLSAVRSHEQLRTAATTLRIELDDWSAQNRGDLALPTHVALGNFTDSLAYVQLLHSETVALSAFLASVMGQLGTEVTFDLATEALDARRTVFETDAEFAAQLLSIEFLTGPLSTDVGVDETRVLRSKLQWTRDVRVAMTPEHDAGILREPVLLTADQLAALSQSFAPPALTEAHATWVRRRNVIIDAFDDSRRPEMSADFADSRTARSLISDLQSDVDGPANWLDMTEALSALRSIGLSKVTDYAVSSSIPKNLVTSYVTVSILRSWVDRQINGDDRLTNHRGMDWTEAVAEFRRLDRALVDGAVSTIVKAGTARRPRAGFGQASIIRREAEKKKKHIPVRDLIANARDVIQAIQPCFMMSPLAVSQYLPNDIDFDVVIFDEASQVTPGDAVNCIYRGRALITAGDQKQLPPTTFFMNSSSDDLEPDEEDLAMDYESVLDLMKSSGNFNALTLRWHYRSRHEHLIAYSNASFYGGNLITFPGAIQASADLGVKYIHVDGIYRRSSGQDNPIEAIAVAQRIIHHFDTRPNSSLGVVAFSAAQRDTIENALTLARADRPELERFFDDSRLDGFFIKSLEFVQGDERDVIIFSIGYGPDDTGKVYKNFGALNKDGGERRLNVAVTRARELVEVVTSMSAAQIGDVTNEGSRHLRRYLDFAERGPAALSLELGDKGLGTDSPFEDSVIDSIRSWGFEVQPQVGVAGYRIDIGVKHPNFPGAFMVGVECDGAMYHSSRTARDRDRLRHDVLVGLGWQIHHIWGTGWYRNRAREEARLKALLEELAGRPMSGRTASPNGAARREPVTIEFEPVEVSTVPQWAIPYEKAAVSAIPSYLDLGDWSAIRRLTDFVREISQVESPIHIDQIAARLRDATGVGRVGSRILANLTDAALKVDAQFDGEFVRQRNQTHLRVRTPVDGIERPIEHVADEELALAMRHAVSEAGGATRIDVMGRVASTFGWRRKSAAMSTRLIGVLDRIVDSGIVEETNAGLRIRGD